MAGTRRIVATVTTLADRINERRVVLDGGLATQLEAQGSDLSDDLWSARLLRDDPETIVDAHRAFFAAGAEVATTASYQASFEGFAKHGIDAVEGRRLMTLSVTLAHRAAQEFDKPTWVAASVGPYGATLADGSEYRGDYGLTVDELREFHRPRMEVLSGAGADVLAIETIPCAAEVEAVLSEASALDVPYWLSLTVDGAVTRAGEPLGDVYAMANGVRGLLAVGVNCSTPHDVHLALQTARQQTELPGVAYPNSGESWDGVQRTWDGDPLFDPFLVAQWLDDGARLIGGCCRVTPAQISQIGRLV